MFKKHGLKMNLDKTEVMWVGTQRKELKHHAAREETNSCIVGRTVKSRIKWAGHRVRMRDERLPKRSETKKQEGCRKRGRPLLRWEDCVKRDLRKAADSGGRKVERKANHTDQRNFFYKSIQPHSGVTPRPASPLKMETRGKTRNRFREIY